MGNYRYRRSVGPLIVGGIVLFLGAVTLIVSLIQSQSWNQSAKAAAEGTGSRKLYLQRSYESRVVGFLVFGPCLFIGAACLVAYRVLPPRRLPLPTTEDDAPVEREWAAAVKEPARGYSRGKRKNVLTLVAGIILLTVAVSSLIVMLSRVDFLQHSIIVAQTVLDQNWIAFKVIDSLKEQIAEAQAIGLTIFALCLAGGGACLFVYLRPPPVRLRDDDGER